MKICETSIHHIARPTQWASPTLTKRQWHYICVGRGGLSDQTTQLPCLSGMANCGKVSKTGF